MIKRLLNNKGMTLIEVMLAILIAGGIAAAMGVFLTAHVRTYETTQDIIDVQYEGQLALNNMSRIAMESKGVNSIVNAGGFDVDLDADYHSTISVISFKGLYDETNNWYIYHIFTYDQASGSTEIWYSNSTDAALTNPYNESLFARNIIAFEAEPAKGSFSGGLGGESYNESDGIQFNLTLEDGNAELDISTLAKYRNKND
jgi:prepilin-type N-terminal cleavage/methylation domain-containing protein